MHPSVVAWIKSATVALGYLPAPACVMYICPDGDLQICRPNSEKQIYTIKANFLMPRSAGPTPKPGLKRNVSVAANLQGHCCITLKPAYLLDSVMYDHVRAAHWYVCLL